MVDLRRITGLTVLLLVLLRISIGWQFLYEGLWKFNEKNSSRAWTAEGFLKNARGPFRDTFRELTGDPDDLNWLNYKHVNDNWIEWRQRFIDHYQLSEKQTAALNKSLDGSAEYVSNVGKYPLEQLPPEVAIALKTSSSLKKAISFDAGKKRLVVPGEWHITPREVNTLKKKAPIEKNEFDVIVGGDEINIRFHKALDDVYLRQSRLGAREKLRSLLLGNQDRIGLIQKNKAGTVVIEERMGDNEKYQNRLADYEKLLAEADIDFENRHGDFYKRRIAELRASLVLPVKALEADMKDSAWKLLSSKQMALGPVSPTATQMSQVNTLTIWMLLVLGLMLITGLGTRMAALAGAGMLLSFYLAYPPWPGVVPVPGPEHSLFVNKNLIEVLALFALAAMPTGSWFGLDGLIRSLIRGKKNSGNQTANSQPGIPVMRTK